MAKEKATPILTGSRDTTGIMRPRDVRQRLLGKVDPELLSVIETIADINHHNMLALAELASMFDKMVNAMQGILQVAENMKDRTDKMARAMREDVEGSEDENTVN